MSLTRPQPLPPKRRPYLTALVFGVVALALVMILREAHRAGEARRNIPPACLAALARLPVEVAQNEGLPLRDCARRRQPSEGQAALLGPWSYGQGDALVAGHIALLREETPEGFSRDRLMHVRVEESYLFLNELTLEGTGCAGGVAEAYVRGESFGMIVNLTPEAVLRFRQNPEFERTYAPGDLATAPTACAGRLTMIDRRPVMIQLNAKTMTPGDGRPAVAPVLSSRQGCFERLLGRYATDNRQTLLFPDGYDAFVADYVAACAPTPAPKKGP